MPRPAAELDDFSQIVAQSKSALDLLVQHQIAPIPSRYAVAYLHETGEMPSISAAIDGLSKRNKLTAANFDEVYDRFFGYSLSREKLLDAGLEFRRNVDKISGVIGTAGDQRRQYETALKNFLAQAHAGDQPSLDQAVAGILEETERMSALNQELEIRLLSSSSEVERMREHLERVELAATQDSLTGIINRRRFDSVLRQTIDAAARKQSPVSLLMVDIDHFKKFNDAHGYQMGDQILKLVARHITDSIDKEGLAARFGGEEFSVILPATELRAAVEIGNQIRERVGDRKVLNRRTGADLGRITMSLGVAELRPDDSSQTFIDRAEDALYLAKSLGRNRVVADGGMAGNF